MDTLRYPTPQAWASAICDAIREKEGSEGKINHQDAPDRILAIQTGPDTSGITAKPENVSEAVQFLDADGVLRYGTMPEVADAVVTLDGNTTEHTIEEGHHAGGGSVRIVPDTSNRFTPTKEEQEYTPSAGKVYTKVVLDPIPDIYKDVSDATMEPAYALSGYTFYGKSGELETGEIVTKTGKQGSTVTANANRYIPAGYHDGTSYITVNVPQEITTIEGEDSTNCTAGFLDVRQGKTFRSSGVQQTGALPEVSPPAIAMTVDNDYSPLTLLIKAVSSVEKTGIVTAGDTAESTARITKYTGATTVTPGESTTILNTAGKYCTDDIYVNGVVSNDKEYYLESGKISITTYEQTQMNIPLSKITDIKHVFIFKTKDPSDKHQGSTIYALYKDNTTLDGSVVSEDQYYYSQLRNDVSTIFINGTLRVSSGTGEYFWDEYMYVVVGT